MDYNQSLSEWAKDKPLSILQLDPADRAVLKIADERDAIQKKTFTKWLNKHLKKHWRYSEANRHIEDLFEDLRDGHNLVSLLEVLSGEILSRERGRMRFHQLQNVQMALDFLKSRNIRLVNIRPEDIVDGNPKLTLGLIWTIILHFQISDIITGFPDETVTAREALLKWAQRTTERYPGVKVNDFTNSWKDGLAFNAILHRNRPDLLDFRSLRNRNPKDNIELAFSIAEKEFGITRLLDPEDVDTPEPDEKSLITYISSMYDVFPEPPSYHPFADEERNRKMEEYKDVAKCLNLWMQESLNFFSTKKSFASLIDLKSLLSQSSKFRTDEIPKRNRDKQRLSQLYRDIQKMSQQNKKNEFQNDLKLEEIEKQWNLLLNTLQESDKKIKDEISKLEKLQKLVERFNRESKVLEGKLIDLERKIKEGLVQRLHVDVKYNIDQIENELKQADDLLKVLKKDVSILEDKKYHQISEINLRFCHLRDKYEVLSQTFHSHLEICTSEHILDKKSVENKKDVKHSIDINGKHSDVRSMPSLKEHIEWIEKKYKCLTQIEFVSDLLQLKSIVEQLKAENKIVEQYSRKISVFSSQKFVKESDVSSCTAELEKLGSRYNELVLYTIQKLKEGESVLEFVQSASRELKWMNDKEETETCRDWSARNLNLVMLEQHQEMLTNDLEKREVQFSAVQKFGERLLIQKHPGSKCIEDLLKKMQSQWSWLLQLTMCLEIHLSNAQAYHQYFKDIKECENWFKKTEEKLNSSFSKSIFSIDEGERCLNQMQELKEELSRYSSVIDSLLQRSVGIVPLKLRKGHPTKPITVISVCTYKSANITLQKDEKVTLKDASHKTLWKIVTSAGNEGSVPGVCFIIPPPNAEAIDSGKSLKKKYEDVLTLWTTKQRKLRQNLIVATVKVVKSWDVSQNQDIDISQQEAIISALNSDAEKLFSEKSGPDSSLLKLKEDIELCNASFQTLQKMAESRGEKSPKGSGRKLSDTIQSLQSKLTEKEKFLQNKILALIVWDLDTLENLILAHKEFETELKEVEEQMNEVSQIFKNISRKSTAVQMKYDILLTTWNKIWELSNTYIEKLKVVEVSLHHLSEAAQIVSNTEVQLASFDNLSSKLEDLRQLHDNLLSFQVEMQHGQTTMDDLQESTKKLRDFIKKIRCKQNNYSDVNKYENDAKKLMSRWNSAKAQIVERLRSCGASSELLQAYKTKVEKNNLWISETTLKVNSLKSFKRLTTKEIEINVHPAMDLYSCIADKGSSIEESNTLAFRYIREAKIYDLRLKHYKENLEEEHPSLDASLSRKGDSVSGADDVIKEIEELNNNYFLLSKSILDFLDDLKEHFSEAQYQKWMPIISNAVPVIPKVYNANHESTLLLDFSIPNKDITNIEDFCDSDKNLSVESILEVSNDKIFEKPGNTSLLCNSMENLSFNLRASQLEYLCEEILPNNLFTSKCIYNPENEKLLTIHEACAQNILNLEAGKFFDNKSNKTLSLQDAVLKGFIHKSVPEILSMRCGLYFPGKREELNLLDAILNGVYDLKTGSLLNPLDNKIITITDAFHLGIIKKTSIKKLLANNIVQINDLSTTEGLGIGFQSCQNNVFNVQLTDTSPNFEPTVKNEYATLMSVKDQVFGITLAEAIDHQIFQDSTGKILDAKSGLQYTVQEAVLKGILRSDVSEIVDVKNMAFITLAEGLMSGIVNDSVGKFINSQTLESYSFGFARKKNLIYKPLTLKEAYENFVLNDDGVNHPITGRRITVLEGISCGVLNQEIRCIRNPLTNDLLSASDALKSGIILPNGKFSDFSSGQEILLSTAINRGLITSVTHKTIFNIAGIKDMNRKELISFNAAIDQKIIDLDTLEYKDSLTNEFLPLKDAVEKEYIQSSIYDMLCKPIGIKDGCEELNLLQCCKRNYIDFRCGQLKDPNTNKNIYIKEAMDSGKITRDGALLLRSLLNIPIPTTSIAQAFQIEGSTVVDSFVSEILLTDETKVNPHIMQSVRNDLNEGNVKVPEIMPSIQVLELPPDGWYLKDAINKKLFNPETGLFTVPGTDRLVSFEETIKMEIINSNSALVSVPNSKQVVTLHNALELRILDSTGHYHLEKGTVLPMKMAIEENLISLSECALFQKDSSKQISKEPLIFKNLNEYSHDAISIQAIPDIINLRKCVEASVNVKNQNTPLLTESVLSFSSDLNLSADTINLCKVPKILLTIKDALLEEIIDEETANVLTEMKQTNFVPDTVITSNVGKVLDCNTGEFISLKNAIDQGFIDIGSGKILVPVGVPLSFPEAQSRGLIHMPSQSIIHPESGHLLTIENALLCDIINPFSLFVNPGNSECMTVAEAVSFGIINGSGNIQSNLCQLSVSEAVTKNYFKNIHRQFKYPPLLSLTFPTALQYGYIDVELKEYIYPTTKKRISVQKAFELNDLMTIPVQPQQEYFLLDDALNKKLIDPTAFTFKHPVTDIKIDLRKAMQCGLLITKPVRLTLTPPFHSTVYEFMEFKTNFCGENSNATFENGISINDAVEKGLIDFNSGIFHHIPTQKYFPIPVAIQQGLLTFMTKLETATFVNKYSMYQVLSAENIETTEAFTNPISGDQISFKNILENNLLDLNCLIYDVQEHDILSIYDALNLGIINSETGEYSRYSDRKINISKAAKDGNLVFIDKFLFGLIPVEVLHKKSVLKCLDPCSVATTSSLCLESIPLPIDYERNKEFDNSVEKIECSNGEYSHDNIPMIPSNWSLSIPLSSDQAIDTESKSIYISAAPISTSFDIPMEKVIKESDAVSHVKPDESFSEIHKGSDYLLDEPTPSSHRVQKIETPVSQKQISEEMISNRIDILKSSVNFDKVTIDNTLNDVPYSNMNIESEKIENINQVSDEKLSSSGLTNAIIESQPENLKDGSQRMEVSEAVFNQSICPQNHLLENNISPENDLEKDISSNHEKLNHLDGNRTSQGIDHNTDECTLSGSERISKLIPENIGDFSIHINYPFKQNSSSVNESICSDLVKDGGTPCEQAKNIDICNINFVNVQADNERKLVSHTGDLDGLGIKTEPLQEHALGTSDMPDKLLGNISCHSGELLDQPVKATFLKISPSHEQSNSSSDMIVPPKNTSVTENVSLGVISPCNISNKIETQMSENPVNETDDIKISGEREENLKASITISDSVIIDNVNDSFYNMNVECEEIQNMKKVLDENCKSSDITSTVNESTPENIAERVNLETSQMFVSHQYICPETQLLENNHSPQNVLAPGNSCNENLDGIFQDENYTINECILESSNSKSRVKDIESMNDVSPLKNGHDGPDLIFVNLKYDNQGKNAVNINTCENVSSVKEQIDIGRNLDSPLCDREDHKIKFEPVEKCILGKNNVPDSLMNDFSTESNELLKKLENLEVNSVFPSEKSDLTIHDRSERKLHSEMETELCYCNTILNTEVGNGDSVNSVTTYESIYAEPESDKNKGILDFKCLSLTNKQAYSDLVDKKNLEISNSLLNSDYIPSDKEFELLKDSENFQAKQCLPSFKVISEEGKPCENFFENESIVLKGTSEVECRSFYTKMTTNQEHEDYNTSKGHDLSNQERISIDENYDYSLSKINDDSDDIKCAKDLNNLDKDFHDVDFKDSIPNVLHKNSFKIPSCSEEVSKASKEHVSNEVSSPCENYLFHDEDTFSKEVTQFDHKNLDQPQVLPLETQFGNIVEKFESETKSLISNETMLLPLNEPNILKSSVSTEMHDYCGDENSDSMVKSKAPLTYESLISGITQPATVPDIKNISLDFKFHGEEKSEKFISEPHTVENPVLPKFSNFPSGDSIEPDTKELESCFDSIDNEKVLLYNTISEVSNNSFNILTVNCNELDLQDIQSSKSSQEHTFAAIEDNYKVCEENVTKLTTWMNNIEKKLADIGVLQEQIPGLEQQIHNVMVLKNELENHQHLVLTCLDQMRQLAQRGLEVLEKEEINNLQKHLISLKRQYDSLMFETERLLRRLKAALEGLQKFKNELDSLKLWLKDAEEVFKQKQSMLSCLGDLEENSDSFRGFMNDVVAHQADLRFISMAAQKFMNESQEYLKALNSFRINLPAKLPALTVPDSEVKTEVQEIVTLFHNFLNNVNRLYDSFMLICNKYKSLKESAEKVNLWMSDIKQTVKVCLEEQIADEPQLVQEQLDKIKVINMEVVGQSRLIENVLQSQRILLNSLDSCNIVPTDMKSIVDHVNAIQTEYSNLVSSLTLRIKELQRAVIKSQDIQDSLDRVIKWLDESESTLKVHNKAVSLEIGKLNDQVQEFKILKSDIDHQKQSIEMLISSAKDVTDAKNPALIKRVDIKSKEISQRFENLTQKISERGKFLDEVLELVQTFQSRAVQFEDWSSSTLERLESADSIHQMDLEGFSTVIEYIYNQCNLKKDELDSMIKITKNLTSKRDIDCSPLNDKIKNFEQVWKKLEQTLNEKKLLQKSKADQIAAYEALRTKVLDWLLKMERNVEKLEPLVLDQNSLKKQATEIMPLLKEHTDFASSIKKLNDLSSSCDATTPKTEMPKQKVLSPVKKLSSPPQKYASSQFSTQSPLSTISSGFSSTGSSPENTVSIDELSPIQVQMSEINDRYSILGMQLSDHNKEIITLQDAIKDCCKILKEINSFLEEKENQILKRGVSTKDGIEKKLKCLKDLQDKFLEKQSDMDKLKAKMEEISSGRKLEKGSALEDNIHKTSIKWTDLTSNIQEHIDFLKVLKEFQETLLLLKTWLIQKQKMFCVLGPIASDPRMISTQVQQVQVMRDEFTVQKSFMDKLDKSAASALTYMKKNELDSSKMNEEIKAVQNLWDEISIKLNEREKCLEAANGVTKGFHSNLTELQALLQTLHDKFERYEEKILNLEELKKKISEIEDESEKSRLLLTDVDSACQQLCNILSDSASKADIKYKFTALESSYTALRKKIDNKKAEIESSLKEDNAFFKMYDDLQKWMTEMKTSVFQPLSLSANLSELTQENENYELIYKQILDREYEVHLCLNKGTDMINKITSKQDISNLKSKLDNMKKSWEKLKNTAVERNTTLRSTLDICRKYNSSFETFYPWLETEDLAFRKCPKVILQRDALNKLLKDLQSNRNNVSVHIQEYENLILLGENILSSCTSNKDCCKSQIDDLKKKWKHLNKDLASKIQALEEVSLLLSEYDENIKDMHHSFQRLEDKLHSIDSLDVSCEPMLLEHLQAFLLEAKEMSKEILKVKKFSKHLLEKCVSDADNTEIFNTLTDLEKRHQSLVQGLDSKQASMQSRYKVISEFMESLKTLKFQLNGLDEDIDKMNPIARSEKLLKQQLKEILNLKASLSKAIVKLTNAEVDCQKIADEQHITPHKSKSYMEQIKSLQKFAVRLNDRVTSREKAITNVLGRLETYLSMYKDTVKELKSIQKQEESFGIVGGDVSSIRLQQDNFKKFQSSQISPLNKKIEEMNKLGQGLIQSAASCVDISEIEKELESLNAMWNTLQESLNEREKKLDIALLQSGKFQEALSGVEKWLNDTEEMVSNQKGPSSDFKVVKAQIQEQKFLMKMLLDRQNSVVSLKTMGSEIMSSSKSLEKDQVEVFMNSIAVRFEKLILSAEKRMNILEKTIPLSQQLQNICVPLEDWLEVTEKKLNTMSSVPSDEEHFKKFLAQHKHIIDDISMHAESITRLKKVVENLKEAISDDECCLLNTKVSAITEKFLEIKQTSANIGVLLKETQEEINVFNSSYVKATSCIKNVEVHLKNLRTFSVYADKLHGQIKDIKKLKSELDSKKATFELVTTSGEKLMKVTTGEDSIKIKEKLDLLSLKSIDLSNKLNEQIKSGEECMRLAEIFFSVDKKLIQWIEKSERSIKLIENSSLDAQDQTIKVLEDDLSKYREMLETLNHTGSRLSQFSPGEGATSVESLTSRANTRFEKVCEQVQRKAERIKLALQRKYDVIGDIDELYEWFQETEKQISDTEGLSSEPNSLLLLLKKQKVVNEEVGTQKNRVRDIVTAAKKLMRESSSEDLSFIHEKIEKLKSSLNTVSNLSQERLSCVEQALPLAKHFFETHVDLGQWLEEAENEAEQLESPGLNTIHIKKQQDKNKGLIQSVQEHKPLVDKLNKTGSALTKLCRDDESNKVEVILESDNSRYNALRKILREHQIALEEALQATSQFSDKLEGMLNVLTSTADQLHNAEPISAHPDRIQEQINDNKAVLQDLDKRTITLEAVKKAADEVIVKASSMDEPAVRDIKSKLDRLNDLWITIQTAAHNRGKSLEDALLAAEKFWEELTAVMKALKELQVNLNGQEPPAVEPAAVQYQQEVLQDIKQEITHTKPEVDQCRQAGQNLMELCGEPDKPEVQRHIADLDSVWENVTTLYAKREQNLVDAMEKAMQFHETLQNLLEFLDTVEDKFAKLGAVSSDIDSVKSQIDQLKVFKLEVDPHMIQVESLNRQAQELMERTSSDQAVAIREPLSDINKRWNELLKNIVERQREMENTLLKLGQFQHALEELVVWISKTEKTLDELKPVFGDPQVIEVVLAKHKVISNDILAHQSSMDTITRAGHEFVNSDCGTEDAKYTHSKLQDLNTRWQNLQNKSFDRYKELDDALKDAQKFYQDIQDLLMWLNDIDMQLVTSKPVGGLPETAKEQLSRFMDLYNELDSNRFKIENVMQQGDVYLKRSSENSTKSLQQNMRTLKQRWEGIINKANDRKIKLEIALREATEFHEALQIFVEWLTNAEKYLTTMKPVSRCMKSVLEQIEEHRNFQKDVGAHREVMLNLDKKGTHLKYFSQKQDVILIKNLLISVQHRWERVVSKAAERTRALDYGYKEAKEFHDAWTSMSSWLDDAEKFLDSTTPIGNDPVKIKKMISKHKEFQRTLGSKQVTYDSTMKSGRILKDKSPKQDIPLLQNNMDEMKTAWNRICYKSVERQRRLEEALLYSGQFKDAVSALIDWLDKAAVLLSDTKPYHGDLDTVSSLIDQHKTFEEELKNRGMSLESVLKTAVDLKKEASPSDIDRITSKVDELNLKWKSVSELNEQRKKNLEDALHQAEKLYKMVHALLEWLSDAEMKLRFVGSMPEDEDATKIQLSEQDTFLTEMKKQEIVKNDTLELANSLLKKCHPDGLSVIRHWITIIQSRWDEICLWSKQRDQRLNDHLISLKDISDLMDNLLIWLEKAELSLTALEAEPLPDNLLILENLIKDHQTFMNDLSKRQTDVDKISKGFSSKRQNKGLALGVNEKTKDKLARSAPTTTAKSPTLPNYGESDIKHPKAKLLIDKWRHVWLLAMERQRRLQDKYNYLMELDRIKNFDFTEWRTRYLGWMNNKKTRIMDQFKKIDSKNHGKVTKQDFIEGILKSKFATSRLEMERVADVFDRNGDGFIDNKEYIETLRPDREGGPKTDAEKIQDEVQRQVSKCTCVHRFKVYQVGEGKYRFGDSQKLRLVRILRSTVMVRVGGGWVALDEFLVKNDPCRAKGRTNIELREQFVLAEGVSQSMAPFKPKSSPNSSVSSQSGTNSPMPSSGPITKIREKSEKSTPMHRSRSSAENSDVSGPSFSETDSFSNRSGISRNTRSLQSSHRSVNSKVSRPSSHHGSQPSSRSPSDLSQDAIEDLQSKRKRNSSQKLSCGSKSDKSQTESSKIPFAKTPVKLPSNTDHLKK